MGSGYQFFANILDYPGPRLFDDVQDCISSLEPGHIEAARILGEFRSSLEGAGIGRIEEIYTATFDLQAGCCGFSYALYVGERLVAPEGKYALIIGSDCNTRFIDWTDRSMAWYDSHFPKPGSESITNVQP